MARLPKLDEDTLNGVIEWLKEHEAAQEQARILQEIVDRATWIHEIGYTKLHSCTAAVEYILDNPTVGTIWRIAHECADKLM